MYETTEQETVLCHNDLLSKNILIDGDKINFIDFEYASANYQGFDIGMLALKRNINSFLVESNIFD